MFMSAWILAVFPKNGSQKKDLLEGWNVKPCTEMTFHEEDSDIHVPVLCGDVEGETLRGDSAAGLM